MVLECIFGGQKAVFKKKVYFPAGPGLGSGVRKIKKSVDSSEHVNYVMVVLVFT